MNDPVISRLFGSLFHFFFSKDWRSACLSGPFARRCALVLCLASGVMSAASAQIGYRLFFHSLDPDSTALRTIVTSPVELADSSPVTEKVREVVRQLHDKAYLEASCDSLYTGEKDGHAYLHIGEPYQWIRLSSGNVQEAFLAKSGFREKLFSGKPFDLAQVQKLKERIVGQAENNGYPFAAIRLYPVRVDEKGIEAELNLEKGRLIFFDSLQVLGDVKISPHYLHNYLGIQTGEPYSRKKVLQVRDRLRELPFLKEKKNVAVRFQDDKANISLYLEKKKASRFDFLIGVLPDNGRPESKLLVTGTFNAEMQNQFGLGERIYVSFERLRPQTQELELAFTYPYVLDLPFGVDLSFSQYKRDSTYTDVIGNVGVQYLFEGGNYLRAFWKSTASNLITVDTLAIRQGRFPDQLDVRSTDFGLEAYWQRLDYRFNPRKGWSAMLRGSAGTRQIRENQAILTVDESFYDTLPGRVSRFVLEADLARFFPVMDRSTVKTSIRTGAILSEADIYQNEQYRLGGNRLLRGFDEESIFATVYSVFTLEYRLLIGQNSYFYLFGDYAYLEDRRKGLSVRYDHPLGFGAGMTFETTAGVFGLSMAIGKTDRAPADFRNPKIHFGYVSLF